MTPPSGPLPAEEPFVPLLDLSIVFPAFNETARLAAPVRDAARWCRARRRTFEIVVSDDGSSDGTAELVEGLRSEVPELRLVRSPVNRGKGHAVRSGVRASLGALVLIADADGATPIAELARLEDAIAAGADIAIGSRALRAEGHLVQRRWYRHVFGRGFHALVRLFGVRRIRDTQCGFKLFRAARARELFALSRMNGFSFDVEVLLLAQRLGCTISEIPVAWTHQPGSRINLVTDSARMAWDLLRIRLRLFTEQAGTITPSAPRQVPTART